MSLVLYNTMTGKKEELFPVEKGKLKIYVCGPTVYDDSHVGHARAVVVFDVLVRYLRTRGFEVDYVRNFTDLDDKIIQRARERGLEYLELAEDYIRSFHEDMDALGALRPDREPRATEYIDRMLDDVRALVDAGAAYQVDGDVYFDVARFDGYGRLSGRNIEDMKAGARVKIDERKRSPLDFALWKESKPGEPAWDSPWGPGRPGWHIECSTMSYHLLGEVFDIHGGGHDLVFPHHENEIAQSAALGRRFARLWMHNGFVNVNQEKMSKSLGNFFTVKEILARFHPEVLRLFLVSKHYRGPIDYTDENLEETARSLDRAYRSIQLAHKRGLDPTLPKPGPETDDIRGQFTQALDDDLNTARALGFLFEAVREINRLIDEAGDGPVDLEQIGSWVAAAREMGSILGILGRDPEAYFQSRAELGLTESDLTPERIGEMVRARSEARARKDWAEADRIRDRLKDYGVVLEDAGGETRWRMET